MLRSPSRVLVFPCGSEIGLEIHRSLRFSKDFELIGASSVADHGASVFDLYVDGLPMVDDDRFIERLNDVIDEYGIEFVFPAHDSVVLKLAQQREKVHAVVMTSSASTCEISRSKRATYALFANVVRTPRVYAPHEVLPFPVFLKPDVGQGSKGTLLAHNQDEVDSALAKDPTLLVMENLTGEEYTIDCFSTRAGELAFVQARERRRVSNGISVNSRTVELDGAAEFASRIHATTPMVGAWFLQVKRAADGQLALLETAPRVAGTMAVSRMTGANLPLMSLYDAQGVPISVEQTGMAVEVDRALANRFTIGAEFQTVFVDFDDTLILGDLVNDALIAFLYRCSNAGKALVLLTRHESDLAASLASHHIAPSLFAKIIHLRAGEAKSDYVSAGSIFIDDSFRERRDVRQRWGVPVFDVSEAVELT
jgi:hypothetical protein